MKVVVTGGAGFIGSNVVRRLRADGVDHVAVIDDFSTGARHNLENLDVELFEGSILDEAILETACKAAESIIHLAARPSVPLSMQNPVASHDVNVTGTVNVLEAARKTGAHVSFASSSSVYGANPELPKAETLRPLPVSPYGASKLGAESYVLAYQTSFQMETVAFRFFNVYGPGQAAHHAYAAAVPSFIGAALSGKPLKIHGDGLQTRDFTYVDSVAEVLSQAARRRVSHPTPVNLAFGTRHTVLHLVDTIESLLGAPLDREFHEQRPGDVRDSQADNRVLRSLFPELKSVELADGIHRTMEWTRSRMVTA